MRTLPALALAAAAAPLVAPAASAQFYSETFDDGAAATRWSVPIVDSEFNTFDGSVDYAFDYSTVGIPSAPGTTTTTGIQFIANLTDETADDEGEAIGILSDYTLPTGDFILSMDVYAFSLDPATDPTTEYITLGIGAVEPNSTLFGLTDDVPARFGLSQGNGLAYQVIADDGSGTGVIRYEDAGNADTGTETSLGATGADDEGDQFLNAWATLTITKMDGLVSYEANGIEYDTDFDTAGLFDGGSIMIGLTDVFNSVGGTNVFTVIDNVTVSEIPEPASLALLATGGLVLLRRRRA